MLNTLFLCCKSDISQHKIDFSPVLGYRLYLSDRIISDTDTYYSTIDSTIKLSSDRTSSYKFALPIYFTTKFTMRPGTKISFTNSPFSKYFLTLSSALACEST